MQIWTDLIVSIVGVGVFGATIWAVKDHFVSTQMLPRAKLISVCAVLNTVLLIYLGWRLNQPLLAQIFGSLIVVASGVLFFAAIKESRDARLRFAFDPEKPASLLDTGPYAVVRHPFYVSYIMLWSGWATAVWSLWTLPLLLALVWLYYDAASMEENNFAQTPMAQAHADYKKRVGFFIPRFR